jgi:hypothetical protein
VRQLNVRSQTTKDKCGTLPLYAYEHAPPAPRPVDFVNILKNGVEKEQEFVHKKGNVVQVMENSTLKIGVVSKDMLEGDTELQVMVYEANECDAMTFTPSHTNNLAADLLVKELDLPVSKETILLTDMLYEQLFGSSPDREQPEISDDQAEENEDILEALQPVVATQVVGASRGQR